jgi:hypothetical protein
MEDEGRRLFLREILPTYLPLRPPSLAVSAGGRFRLSTSMASAKSHARSEGVSRSATPPCARRNVGGSLDGGGVASFHWF